MHFLLNTHKQTPLYAFLQFQLKTRITRCKRWLIPIGVLKEVQSLLEINRALAYQIWFHLLYSLQSEFSSCWIFGGKRNRLSSLFWVFAFWWIGLRESRSEYEGKAKVFCCVFGLSYGGFCGKVCGADNRLRVTSPNR
jgi:hypothetical protein